MVRETPADGKAHGHRDQVGRNQPSHLAVTDIESLADPRQGDRDHGGVGRRNHASECNREDQEREIGLFGAGLRQAASAELLLDRERRMA